MGNLSTGFYHNIVIMEVASLEECYKIMGQDLSLFSAAKFLEVVGPLNVSEFVCMCWKHHFSTKNACSSETCVVYLKQMCEIFDINNFSGVPAINVQQWKNCEILCFQRVLHNT
jgi:hypothetical protein